MNVRKVLQVEGTVFLVKEERFFQWIKILISDQESHLPMKHKIGISKKQKTKQNKLAVLQVFPWIRKMPTELNKWKRKSESGNSQKSRLITVVIVRDFKWNDSDDIIFYHFDYNKIEKL